MPREEQRLRGLPMFGDVDAGQPLRDNPSITTLRDVRVGHQAGLDRERGCCARQGRSQTRGGESGREVRGSTLLGPLRTERSRIVTVTCRGSRFDCSGQQGNDSRWMDDTSKYRAQDPLTAALSDIFLPAVRPLGSIDDPLV